MGLAARKLRMTPPAAGGGALITDSFNRADNASSLGNADTGEAWSALTGTWGISSNAAYIASATNDAIAVIDCGSDDMAVEVTRTAGASGDYCLIARATDSSNLYLYSMANGQIFKKVSGTYTLLAGSGGQTAAIGDVITVTAIGTTLTWAKNGSVLVSITDSAISTGTFGGIRNDSNPGDRFDDFSLEAI